jgi:hypothetical protein
MDCNVKTTIVTGGAGFTPTLHTSHSEAGVETILFFRTLSQSFEVKI